MKFNFVWAFGDLIWFYFCKHNVMDVVVMMMVAMVIKCAHIENNCLALLHIIIWFLLLLLFYPCVVRMHACACAQYNIHIICVQHGCNIEHRIRYFLVFIIHIYMYDIYSIYLYRIVSCIYVYAYTHASLYHTTFYVSHNLTTQNDSRN